MKSKNSLLCVLAFLASMVICGCEPEETFVLVNGSALKKAAAGEAANAQVEMIFDIDSSSDRDLPGKIKRVALPYLGSGATIEIEKTERKRYREGGSIRDEEIQVKSCLDDAKMVCRFSIPVGTEEVLKNAPRSILWLKYSPENKLFRLVPGNAVVSLNSELAAVVDSDVKFEYKGGESSGILKPGTTIKIVGDDPVKIGVFAVEVDGKPVICGSASVGSDPIKINYNNKFYKEEFPFFVLQ